MATLLRKVWESVSKRSDAADRARLHPPSSSSSSSTSSSSSALPTASLGVFDQIPWDVLTQILKLVGPEDTAKMRAVNKYWKSMASDNELWLFFLLYYPQSSQSILFAELNLRSGHPLPTFSGQLIPESFMNIYSQRMQVPGSIIIDGGSGYCKFGWSKYACPSGRSATFLEFGNIESPMKSRLRQFFVTIYNRMQVKPALQPVVVSVPILHYDNTESAEASREQLITAIYTTLFEMNVPAVCAVSQANLALYSANRTSGIVVNIGFQVTSVVPILNGEIMHKVGVEVLGLGALKLTGFLKDLMQQNNINFESLYTVRTLKENLCYVAYDYEAELRKDTEASFEAAGEGWFTLSRERFQTGEIFFQPRMAGVRTMGLHQAIALCMDHCQDAGLTTDDSWFKTIVLTGGSACLPGLSERLEKELHGLRSPLSQDITVIPPTYGPDTAWFGAKIISNLSTFPGAWCITKKEFRQKSKTHRPW